MEANKNDSSAPSVMALTVVVDIDGRITRFNHSCEILTGYSAEQALGCLLWELLLPLQERSAFINVFKTLSQSNNAQHGKSCWLDRQGDSHLISWNSITLSQPPPAKTHIVITGVDLTEPSRTESEICQLSSAVEQTADSVLITDRFGRIEYVNLAFEKTTGYCREEVIGKRPSIVKSERNDPEIYRRLWETILAGHSFNDILINRHKDGSFYYEEKTITPIKNDAGEITHFVSTGKDITERMEVQHRLYHIAHHDSITNLPNRVLLMDRLHQGIARTSRLENMMAVMFLDLDLFKKINDTLGHDVGDELLKVMAARLQRCVHAENTVARLGGDEFAVLLENINSTQEAKKIAASILETVSQPIFLAKRELFISASIGISFFPGDGEDAATLLKSADIAMYHAKARGRNGYNCFRAEMHVRAFERMSLESQLRHALKQNEFVLNYQPLVELKSGVVIGMEALLRWHSPTLGVISPAEFIPLLEETGMIIDVGEWVLRTACYQAKSWQLHHANPIRISVNLSARQFRESNLSELVAKVLAETGLPSMLLELEITESVVMQNAQQTIDTLRSLSARGIRIAIDDFGTGYSSLSYLKRFPINTLKIDRSFIDDIPDDVDSIAIVEVIITLAHTLKLEVVAEGVEQEVQADFLRNAGCEVMQGYLFSRPLSLDQTLELLSIREAV